MSLELTDLNRKHFSCIWHNAVVVWCCCLCFCVIGDYSQPRRLCGPECTTFCFCTILHFLSPICSMLFHYLSAYFRYIAEHVSTWVCCKCLQTTVKFCNEISPDKIYSTLFLFRMRKNGLQVNNFITKLVFETKNIACCQSRELCVDSV